MSKESFQEAQRSALSKVYEKIAETGNPTDAQLSFIEMMKPPKSQFSELEEAGKALMAIMGFMEGK